MTAEVIQTYRDGKSRRLRLLALAVVVALGGCGGSEERLTLALEFTPNANHAPLYAAADEGAFEIRPPAGPDVLKLVASGRADLGVIDIHDLAIAREQGADVVGIAALVDRPLAAVAARPGIKRPKDLEGRTVGVSGLPSDPAFIDAVVEADGGDPSAVNEITIGFTAVTRLLTGRVEAAPVFWNAEGVVLQRRGLDPNLFRVDQYGAPPYPEVVLFTSSETLAAEPEELRAALEAVDAGVATVRDDPATAAQRIADAAEADLDLTRAQLDATAPLYGTRLDRSLLEDWAAFDARIGIVDSPPDVGATFDFEIGKELTAQASE